MSAPRIRPGVLLGVAMEAIRRNRMRSALTALGIVVGVACIVSMFAIGEGSRESVAAQVSSLGTNFLVVYPGVATQSGARIFTGQPTLTQDDADAIRRECPSVAYASPFSRAAAQVVAEGTNWGTSIQGVGIEYPRIRSWSLTRGSFFGASEVRGAARVCLLGATVADALFGDENPIDRSVRIKNVPFRVLGVLERKGASLTGQDQDDTVLAPYTTVMRFLNGATKLDAVVVSAASADAVEAAQVEIEALLRQRHRILPGQDSDFLIRSQQEMSQAAAETSGTMARLLAALALVSLLVGGIGVVNIMLVSVAERMHEIGLRLAIGARRRDILAQFLVEAIALSTSGGVIGVLVGTVASRILASRAGWPIAVSAAGAAVAFAFSAAAGIAAGFYPAWKASRLQPVEAMRAE